MALTQVSTGGIKDATVATADIADNAVTAGKLASGVQTTINNNSNNRVITGSNTTNALEGEANLTYNGQLLQAANSHINIDSGYAYQWGDSHERIEQSDGKIEFFTNNSEKMTRSGSNLGIGTTSPAELLHLQSTAGNTKLRLTQSGSTTDQINGAIHFGNSTDAQLCEIRGYTSGSTSSGYLQFLTTSSGSDVTAMTINTAGNVGVGTASPATIMHLKSTSADCDLQVESTGSATDARLNLYAQSNGVSQIRFGDQDDANVGLLTYEHADNSMQFRVGDAERMRINNVGQLIIGATSTNDSSEMFLVAGAASNNHCGLGIKTNNNVHDGIIAFHDSDANYRGSLRYDHSVDAMFFNTSGSERMRIDSAGRTGINCLEDYAGFVQMKPPHNFENGASGIQSSGTQATLRVRTSSNSSMSLYIGGLDDSIDSARPYLQVGNRSGSGPSTFYDLYLCPFGGTVRSKAIIPKEDNQHDLGTSALRWDDVYATNGTINTSDRTKKNTIVDSDLGLSFVNKLKPVSYKLNGGTRTHYGLIAQDVETVLSEISKPTTDFAGYIKGELSDVLYTEDEPLPAGKNVGDVKTPASINYGLRYGEFIAPLIKAVQELSNEVSALKAK